MAFRNRQRVFRPDRRIGGRRCPGEASTPLVLRIRHRRPGAIGMLVIDAARGCAVRINGSSLGRPMVEIVKLRSRLRYAETSAWQRAAATAFLGSTPDATRSEEHTSELQSLMRISYAVFCLKKKQRRNRNKTHTTHQTHTKYRTTNTHL